ncbi:MAG: CorA family divalent cation transporter [Lachnospiraceae bacterium]|nr:CorA family divalent cation transporter [Lachnospiraceae bacterium]MDD3615780.1 CorA family divalent cation transporter [Lachnospiraceae bacterium]
MIVLSLGEQLAIREPSSIGAEETGIIYITTSAESKSILEKTGMRYEEEIDLAAVGFTKIETQQYCLCGSFCIPKLLDVVESRYRIQFFLNKDYIVIVDDDDFSQRLIARIRRRKIYQGETKEKFIYNFIAEFMNRDLELLVQYEKRIMHMEEEVVHGKMRNFQSQLIPLRKELLTLRSYYDEISDMGKELEENENGFFAKKQLKYFGVITDRAERLMGKTQHLLEYAQQVKDAYQSEIDARQNSNMQFLTVISTIFFPLTLVTGWYGMNFENMPELKNGYPGVIILSLVVIAVCIFIFKKKKIF